MSNDILKDLSVGKDLFLGAIRTLDPDLVIDAYLKMRTAGRLLEEAVELCLESGASPRRVLGHVMDAIHSEALKENKYPSQMQKIYTLQDNLDEERQNILIELSDVVILTDYLRWMHGYDWSEIADQNQKKAKSLIERSQSGDAVLIDGLLYGKGKR